MKNLVALLICSICIFSCKKSGDSVPGNFSLLQHSWKVVSERGEALFYAGSPNDYYNFDTNNMLYKYVNARYDTSDYSLLPDQHTLLLYPIVNGVKTTTAVDFNIDSISGTDLILSHTDHNNPTLFLIATLKR